MGRLGLRGLDDVAVESVDGYVVALRTPGGVERVVVTRSEAEPRPITCGDSPEPVPAFELAA